MSKGTHVIHYTIRVEFAFDTDGLVSSWQLWDIEADRIVHCICENADITREYARECVRQLVTDQAGAISAQVIAVDMCEALAD
jgi:hypothetical protein